MEWLTATDDEEDEADVDDNSSSDDRAGSSEVDADQVAVRLKGDKTESADGADSRVISSVAASASRGAARRRRHRKRFECFALRVVYEAGKTGFEEAKEFVAAIGSVIAGRYVVQVC